MPGLASSAALLFTLIFREFPIAVFISTPATNVLSVILVGYNTEGAWPDVAVVAVFLSAVSLAGMILSNVLAARFDLGRRRGRSVRRRGAGRQSTAPPAPREPDVTPVA
jgi:ABC-type spermidine/putrescine transport system permease subunit II